MRQVTAATNEDSGDTTKNDVWSIRRVLAWAADDLKRRGNEGGRLDVELLLGRVLKLDRIGLIMQSERPLAAAELATFRELFKRRRGGRTGRVFAGRARVLRHLAARRRARLDPAARQRTAGTRSRSSARARAACWGRRSTCARAPAAWRIAFARQRPTWSVTASDISEGALAVATENAHRTGAIRNLRLVQGSLFAAVGGERFDLITANPPYIATAELAELPVDVRDFEAAASARRRAPTAWISCARIATQAPSQLAAGGVLALGNWRRSRPSHAGHSASARLSRARASARLGRTRSAS